MRTSHTPQSIISSWRPWLVAMLLAIAWQAGAAAESRAEGELGFLGCLQDLGGPSGCATAAPLSGLEETFGVTVSPDGRHVYAAAVGDDAITAFSRDGAGGLGFVDSELDGVAGVDGLGGAIDLAVSPDGLHVYATGFSDDSVAAFTRDSASGALDFIASYTDNVGIIDGLDGARGLAVSPDGSHVYVAGSLDDAVAVFSRDPGGGGLSFFDHETDGIGGVTGLEGAHDIAVSADGRHIYVSGYDGDSLATFARDATSGAIDFVERERDGVGGVSGLDGAAGVVVAPDGRHVYVAASEGGGALAAFTRAADSGALGFVGATVDGGGGGTNLAGARDVAISPDGKHLYVVAAKDSAITAFSRDGLGGGLAFPRSAVDGVGTDGLGAPWSVAVSPDGLNVYVASTADDAVSTFSRVPDTTPPRTTIVSGPVGSTTDPTPAFAFASDDPGFTAGFECRTDGAPFAPCASPLTAGPLPPGPHSFTVRATDTAGNVDPAPPGLAFTVVPPDTAVGLLIIGKRVRVSRKGIAKPRLRCPAAEANPPCRGRLVLRTKGKLVLGKGKRAKRRRVVLAKGGFRVASGRTKVVRMKLGKRKLALLRSNPRARKVLAIARARDGAGNRKTVRKVLRAVPRKPREGQQPGQRR